MKLIIELKGLEKGCKKALEQIERLHYDSSLLEESYKDIIKYGICFYKKECMAVKGE